MKRYIRSNFDVRYIEEISDNLKDLFKNKSLISIQYSEPYSDDMIKKYIVSRRLSGKGIELYSQIVSKTEDAAINGGHTLATGPWYVAQLINSIEPNLDNWYFEYS